MKRFIRTIIMSPLVAAVSLVFLFVLGMEWLTERR